MNKYKNPVVFWVFCLTSGKQERNIHLLEVARTTHDEKPWGERVIERVIASSWPERIEPGQIGASSDLEDHIVTAWAGLVHVLELVELID